MADRKDQNMMKLPPDEEMLMQEMAEAMWPTYSFLEPTGESCQDEDCDCGGKGLQSIRVTIETKDN